MISGVLLSKTVYSFGFAQNWKLLCFIPGLRTVIVSTIHNVLEEVS